MNLLMRSRRWRKKVKLNNLYFFHRCWSCAWWKLRCRLSLSLALVWLSQHHPYHHQEEDEEFDGKKLYTGIVVVVIWTKSIDNHELLLPAFSYLVLRDTYFFSRFVLSLFAVPQQRLTHWSREWSFLWKQLHHTFDESVIIRNWNIQNARSWMSGANLAICQASSFRL